MKNCKLVVRISILIIGLLIGANVCALAHNFDNEVVNFTQWVMGWVILAVVGIAVVWMTIAYGKQNEKTANNGKGISIGYTENDEAYQYQVLRLYK